MSKKLEQLKEMIAKESVTEEMTLEQVKESDEYKKGVELLDNMYKMLVEVSKVEEYVVIEEAQNLQNLKIQVGLLMELGYEPLGGVVPVPAAGTFGATGFMQTMIKKKG